MENCKSFFANLGQRYETDFIRFCSQTNNVSQSFTLFLLNDEIHQIYEILDSFIRLCSLKTLKRFKRLISKIMLCMRNKFFLPLVITSALYSWTTGNVSYVFSVASLSFSCNHQTVDNSELREMYLKFNFLLCPMRQTIGKCPFNIGK